MSRNFVDLDALHEKFAAAGIEHRYSFGDLIITVVSGTHIWTVSGNLVIYWGDGTDVCKSSCHDVYWTSEAFDYIADVYSKAQ